MKKLEKNNIAPYYPHKVKACLINVDEQFEITHLAEKAVGLGINKLGTVNWYKNASIKLVLRPLSDLLKEIEVNGEKFVPIIKLTEEIGYYQPRKWKSVYYEDSLMLRTDEGLITNVIQFNIKNPFNNYSWIVNKMYEWHFDIFGLIENNLAIDINTLQNER